MSAISPGLERWFMERLASHPLMTAFAQRAGLSLEAILGTLIPEIVVETTIHDRPRFSVTGWRLKITIGEEAKLALAGIDQIEAQEIVAQAFRDGKLPSGIIEAPTDVIVIPTDEGMIYCLRATTA